MTVCMKAFFNVAFIGRYVAKNNEYVTYYRFRMLQLICEISSLVK